MPEEVSVARPLALCVVAQPSWKTRVLPPGNSYTSFVGDHRGKKRLLLAQPGQLRRLSSEQIGDSIHENSIGRLGLEATRLL